MIGTQADGNQRLLEGYRRSVRGLVSAALKVPIEKRVAGMRSGIKSNKARRKLDRDELQEMVYLPRKIMKL